MFRNTLRLPLTVVASVADAVFQPWHLQSTPSFSVNGWYTFRNTLPAFASLCGPGHAARENSRPKGRAGKVSVSRLHRGPSRPFPG